MPMGITIAGDIYTVAERATAQGYIASVWAISSVVGPTLGGVFSQLGLWRWIFFVNVPLCLLAGRADRAQLPGDRAAPRHRIDYLGAVLLTSGLTLVILGVLEGGQAWAWSSPTSHRRVRRRNGAARRRSGWPSAAPRSPCCRSGCSAGGCCATTTFLALGVGVILIGLTSYVPTYLENSLGVPPLVAGAGAGRAHARLAAVGQPAPAGCSTCGSGFRPTILIGLGLVVVGTGALALLGRLAVGARRRGHLLRHRDGHGPRRDALADRRAGQRRLGRARAWPPARTCSPGPSAARSARPSLGAVANGVIAASGRPETDPVAATDSGAAVFVAVLVAAVLTVVAGLLMPKVDATVGQRRDEPNEPVST